jgi:hypothetical protein
VAVGAVDGGTEGVGVGVGRTVGRGVTRGVGAGVGRGVAAATIGFDERVGFGLPARDEAEGAAAVDGEAAAGGFAMSPGWLVAARTSPRGPLGPCGRKATQMATAAMAMIAMMATTLRRTTSDPAPCSSRPRLTDAMGRRVGVAIGRRRVDVDPRASPAGRIPSACNRDGDAAYRVDAPRADLARPLRAAPPEPGEPPTLVPVRGPIPSGRSQSGRPVILRSAHIPIELSTIEGSRARPASSRGMKRTVIAMKPRTTSVPTIHSTCDGKPQAPEGPSPA